MEDDRLLPPPCASSSCVLLSLSRFETSTEITTPVLGFKTRAIPSPQHARRNLRPASVVEDDLHHLPRRTCIHNTAVVCLCVCVPRGNTLLCTRRPRDAQPIPSQCFSPTESWITRRGFRLSVAESLLLDHAFTLYHDLLTPPAVSTLWSLPPVA